MTETIKAKTKRAISVHRYYRYTGFYSFVGASLKKALLPILAVILGVFLVDKFVVDFGDLFTTITNTYSSTGILSVFFASESILGLIPPEIFIAWSNKTDAPMYYLSLLALLSYLGGVVSYFIGKGIFKIPPVYTFFETKMHRHIDNTRKWGGFLIIVGALLPIPFAMTSIAAGVINYRFKNYLLFGLLRFVRFYLYALAIFNIM